MPLRVTLILARAHILSPRTELWSFIDDTVARAEGSRAEVLPQLLRMGAAPRDGKVGQELICSGKAKLVAKDSELRDAVVKAVTQLEIPCQLVSEAVYLDVDTASGRRRVCRKSAKRFLAGRRRFKSIFKMRRQAALARASRGLWCMGALPQST